MNPDGKVAICVSMPYFVGNLNEETLKHIWLNAQNTQSKLYKWRKLSVADYEECHKQEYCKFCNFCPGMGYLENGFLKKSNVLCAQAKAKMRAYNYLNKG